MFNRTPTHASVTNRDEPPYDTSGRGIPFVGIIPSTTLILMKRLQHDHAGNADGKVSAEEVFSPPRGAHAAPEKDREERNDEQCADQA